jgi:hypothetical protein
MSKNEKEISKYFDVLEKYFLFVENNDENKNTNLLNSIENNPFLKLVGFRIITNVFQINIHRNTDLEDIFFKSKKAFYIYLEYLEQIVSKENIVELNQSDLILFVYSKTIDNFQGYEASNNDTSVSNKTDNKILEISKRIEPLLWFENQTINNRAHIVRLIRDFYPIIIDNKYVSIYFDKIQKQGEPTKNNKGKYSEYLANFIQKVKKMKYTEGEWKDLILNIT